MKICPNYFVLHEREPVRLDRFRSSLIVDNFVVLSLTPFFRNYAYLNAAPGKMANWRLGLHFL